MNFIKWKFGSRQCDVLPEVSQGLVQLLSDTPIYTYSHMLFSAFKTRMQMSENKVALESYLSILKFFNFFREKTFNFGYVGVLNIKILRSCQRMTGLGYCQETCAQLLLIFVNFLSTLPLISQPTLTTCKSSLLLAIQINFLSSSQHLAVLSNFAMN